MCWQLDYDKTSDFDDVSGHWHVEDHPTQQGATRVFYACDVKLHGSVPGPVLNYISKSALKSATGWVKKESEKTAQKTKKKQPSSQETSPVTSISTPERKRGVFAFIGNRQ